MRRRMDFELHLIPLETGGYNCDLKAAGLRDSCYFSPLASYISRERAIRRAREHASRFARKSGAGIGSFRIITDRPDNSGGDHAGQD